MELTKQSLKKSLFIVFICCCFYCFDDNDDGDDILYRYERAVCLHVGYKEQSWRNNTFELQTKSQSSSNQKSMYRHKNRFIDQWNILEEPETSLCMYSQPIFSKDAKQTQWQDSLFSKWHWENCISTCKNKI